MLIRLVDECWWNARSAARFVMLRTGEACAERPLHLLLSAALSTNRISTLPTTVAPSRSNANSPPDQHCPSPVQSSTVPGPVCGESWHHAVRARESHCADSAQCQSDPGPMSERPRPNVGSTPIQCQLTAGSMSYGTTSMMAGHWTSRTTPRPVSYHPPSNAVRRPANVSRPQDPRHVPLHP